MSDIREGPSMYKDGCSLERLHEVGFDRVFHENRKSTAHAKIISCDSVAMLARRNYHSTKALAHILQTCGQGQHSHAFASDGDIKSSFTLMTFLCSTLTNGDLPKEAIVGVHDAIPRDGLWVHIQADKALDLFWSKIIWVGLVDPELL